MYFQKVLFSPSNGKQRELTNLLIERTKAQQPEVRVNLAEKLYGDVAPLVLTFQHENLESVEKRKDMLDSNDEFWAFRREVVPLIDHEAELRIFSGIFSTGIASAPAKFVHAVHFYPEQGKEPQVRTVLEEFAKAYESERSTPFGIHQRRFGTAGSEFVLSNRYSSLTEYEEISQNLPPSIVNMTQVVSPLLRAPMRHNLSQVLVPFPR